METTSGQTSNVDRAERFRPGRLRRARLQLGDFLRRHTKNIDKEIPVHVFLTLHLRYPLHLIFGELQKYLFQRSLRYVVVFNGKVSFRSLHRAEHFGPGHVEIRQVVRQHTLIFFPVNQKGVHYFKLTKKKHYIISLSVGIQ